MSIPRKSDEAKMKMKRILTCKHCLKTLTKKEAGLHVYVCEKVPQEIFNQPNTLLGGTTSNSSLTNPLLGAPEER